MTNEELIDERYRGIRPASGTPPARTTARRQLFDLLGAREIGMDLTECAR